MDPTISALLFSTNTGLSFANTCQQCFSNQMAVASAGKISRLTFLNAKPNEFYGIM
jgi:hypothetical protein